MSLDPAERDLVRTFRDQLEDRFARDPRFSGSARHDREDESTLATRFALAENLWIEVCLRPSIPQIRVGILTNDRWLRESLEQLIEDSGDTMSEFVELAFDEAGLTWIDPPVEHYRDEDKNFYFATGLEIDSLSVLNESSLFAKTSQMLEGYYEAFKPAIRAASVNDPSRDR